MAGEVSAPVLDIARTERQRRTVVLASNATDRLGADLRRLGLDLEFDAVFSSSAIGFAKPDPHVFVHIADAVGVAAESLPVRRRHGRERRSCVAGGR